MQEKMIAKEANKEVLRQEVDLDDIKWKTIADVLYDYMETAGKEMRIEKFIERLADNDIVIMEDLVMAKISKDELFRTRGLAPSISALFWDALVHNNFDNPIILGTRYTAPDETTSFQSMRRPFLEQENLNSAEQTALTQIVNKLSLANIKNFENFKSANPIQLFKRFRTIQSIGDHGVNIFKRMYKKFVFKLEAN